ncbi:MAG: GNAT family N-acetyltransferase [Candidatus Bathyarchaeia archaeon]
MAPIKFKSRRLPENMDIKIKPVSLENFNDLPSFRLFPYSCKYCAFWELLDFDDKTGKEKAEQTKREWFINVGKKFGNCGFIVYVDKKPVGFAQYAPVKYFPAIQKYSGLAPSNDAIFLACLYIANRKLWGKGIGKKLFEKVASNLKKRGYKVVESFARVSDLPSNNIPDWYTNPLGFFIKMGFTVIKSKGNIALVRKEL